jgi:hypothetical protein
MRTSAAVIYKNNASVGNNSNNDMQIGFENGVVGSNGTAMPSVGEGTVILVHNKETMCIGVVIRKATRDESTCWINAGEGGREWKYNFKVRWLTDIVLITPLLKIIIKELCDYSSQDSSKFFDPVCHSSNFRNVVFRLVENI